ncbi:RNA polymerase II subunit A C-terminal domain phosphatase [Fopius arisanus]|uniref:RNA polymerase II subunit A C-terminal domain phosphatase n=2 Tax=Fopius arisanus TaxID=64838 RepID=A0A9R1SZQ2_9HYME|nr:PREDICTED: RNA polymerase II subunit A C-terminal domain phosphatase [Fopius arisanus]
MSVMEVKFPSDEQPGKIIKWRVSRDTMVSAGRILLLYHGVGNDGKTGEKKLRATQFGRINCLLVKPGDLVEPGQVLLRMTGCKHPTVMKDLCAECGADLRAEALADGAQGQLVSEASVPMVHSIPELKVCPELAEKIGKEDEQRLLSDRKLALLVDLDQTIVHTTNDNVPAVMNDVFHYQLYGPNSPWYHTRLRPGTRHFLSEMSKLYELHICTFGARNYAHTVAALLDKEGALFSHRILSRDECFNPASKTANLKALFPCGDDLVCIIDDREDVWQGCGNLVQVKPYHFFKHTGDIHAPPGLEKRDLPEIADTNESSNITETVHKDDIRKGENGIVVDKSEGSSPTDKSQSIVEESTTEESKKENPSEESKPTSEESRDDSPPPEDKNGEGNIEDSKESKEEAKEDKEKNKVDVAGSKKDSSAEDDDHDDYLLYLEDILRRIHAEFYEHIDRGERKPLREIIPKVKRRVLQGLQLTFSGLIPTQQKLEDSRAYRVAKAFGAEVEQDLTVKTTHLVAIKPGTAKVYAAKKNSGIKIVNPDWLWSCAERWERVDERLFPLTAKARGSRIPPPHCSSPDRIEIENPVTDTFANTINPLMSFTEEEIESMDKEVDEDMTDPEMDSSVVDVEDLGIKREIDESDNSDEEYEPTKRRKINDNSSSSSGDRERLDEDNEDDDDDDDDEDNEDDDDDPITRFRRGEGLPDDLEMGDSQDSVEEIDDPAEEDDDREWNAMGAALEREFLSE